MGTKNAILQQQQRKKKGGGGVQTCILYRTQNPFQLLIYGQHAFHMTTFFNFLTMLIQLQYTTKVLSMYFTI